MQKQNDPDSLEDFRTPRFDLDSVYGRGPDDQPYLYDFSDPDHRVIKMLLGKEINDKDPKNENDAGSIQAFDLMRNSPSNITLPKRALTGDPRNDENVIVSQLHGMFLRFHNSIVDYQKSKGLDAGFETVQHIVRWHYQWMILNDFLPTIIDEKVLESILPHIKKGTSIVEDEPTHKFYNWHNQPFMPVEFSGAAYRFGHSMVRPIYRLNKVDNKNNKHKDKHEPRLFIFPELVGFGEMETHFAIDWKLLFDFGNNPTPNTKDRIQPAYKIDTSLVNPLAHLPESVSAHIPPMPSLAELNLVRGFRLGLPSGQAVARAMGIPVIPDNELRIGKATADGFTENKSIADFPELNMFRDNAPLWFYILAEAQKNNHDAMAAIIGNQPITDPIKEQCNALPVKLGKVGGTIVAEVFAGLLLGDQYSFLNQDPLWKPIADFCPNGKFGIAELLQQAMKS